MTTTLEKISEKVRQNAKTWYDAAGLKAVSGAQRDPGADEAKAYETIKLLAGLLTSGTPVNEVAGLLLFFAHNPDVNVSALIKVARDKRADPEVSPFLELLKKTLLPAKAEGGPKDEAAEKERAIAGAKLLYEADRVASMLRQANGLQQENAQDQNSNLERYERALGRKLNDDEKFE